MKHILKCSSCNQYTLKDSCPKCNAATLSPRPARFSLKDHLSKYRLPEKKKAWKERGWL